MRALSSLLAPNSNRGGRFGDEVAGAWSKDVDAGHAIGLLVREHLDAAFCVAERSGAPVGEEGERPLPVLDAALFKLVFSPSDRRDLGRGVHHARDGLVVIARPPPRLSAGTMEC